MRYTFSLFAVLAFIWLANSGLYSPLILFFGLLSVLFVILIARRMKVVDGESLPLHLWSSLPGYYLWLLRKIITSNLEVVGCIWGSLLPGRKPITPVSKYIPTVLRTDLGKVLYANSITLTPGTVSIDVGKDSILVHALTQDGLQELERGEMEQRIHKLAEGDASPDHDTATQPEAQC
ncbi:Na+/H+ antiporter subunit E [Microbulbifer sp. MCCC 1A16149]|uniref:Na+/H+ antiporter subunit E n=1 Tax=Microbulbifer sp. MCCC 1A16149 TaxID=3411322 RepID=UPI003D0F7572